jgi:hypothetical protein
MKKQDIHTQQITGFSDFAPQTIKHAPPVAANDAVTKETNVSNPANETPVDSLESSPPPVIDELPPLELEREQIPAEAAARLEAMVKKPKKIAEAKSVIETNKIQPPQPPQRATKIEPVAVDDLPPNNFDTRAMTRCELQGAANISFFKVMEFHELMTKEYVNNWLVEGLIEKENLGLIFGNSASGKSLIVQDLCYCIAAGIDFHGKKTTKGKVLYVAGEGQAGLQKRFKALREKYNNVDASGLFVSRTPAAFLSTGETGWDGVLNTALSIPEDSEGELSLIVIDTLHRNFGNGDENSSKDFAEFLKAIDIIKNRTGAAVLILHHSGNEVKDRSRGSSSIKASMDVEYCVTKKDDIVTMTNTKMKDFDPPKPMSFLVAKLLDSVVLESTDYIAKKTTKSLTQNSSKSLEALHETIAENGILPPEIIIKKFKGSPQNLPKKVVTIEQWRKFAYDAITVESDGGIEKVKKAKRTAFSRSRTELQKAGSIGIHGDFAWFVQAEISFDFSTLKAK